MSSQITAKVKCTHAEQVSDQVALRFEPDYADGRNAEWAKYTPALSLSMNVKPEVADGVFEVGRSYTLTFTPEET